MAGDCAALGLWIYLRDSRLLNMDYKQGDVKEWNKIEERDFTRFFLAGGLR